MGIYSIPTTTNEVTKYVQESFLESCIDESALSILDDINNIGTKSITEAFKSMVDVSNKIENSSLNEDTKQSLRYSLIENVYCNFSKGTMINDEFLSESAIDSILEFNGNAEKNKEFIGLLKDIDTLTQKNLEKIKRCISDLEKYQHWADDIIKNPSKLSSYITNIYHDNRNNILSKQIRETIGHDTETFNKLKKKSKTFNNKYSEIVMISKKELSAKFDKVEKEIKNLICNWIFSENFQGKYIKNLIYSTNTIINEIDHANGEIFQKQVMQYHDFIIDEANNTLDNINAIRKALNIEFKESPSYKFINAFIKK